MLLLVRCPLPVPVPVPWGHQAGDSLCWWSHGLAKTPAWTPWAGTGVTLGWDGGTGMLAQLEPTLEYGRSGVEGKWQQQLC